MVIIIYLLLYYSIYSLHTIYYYIIIVYLFFSFISYHINIFFFLLLSLCSHDLMTFLKEGYPAFGEDCALNGTNADLLHRDKTFPLRCGGGGGRVDSAVGNHAGKPLLARKWILATRGNTLKPTVPSYI